MTTFEWMNPQTTGILFLWAPVGAKKLGVRFESRSAVGVSFSTSNTLLNGGHQGRHYLLLREALQSGTC